MTYEIGVRNVLRILNSNHSYVFRDTSELKDVESARWFGLCSETSHEDSEHIVEKTGHSMWGKYTSRRGLVLTEKGKEAILKLVDDWRR